ncbi:MAG: hypothetical protein IJF60_06470 [Agathobacter sp.]|nr:hypothetical protein [Agathobacter sp.]
MKKKLLAMGLCVAVIMSLGACGNSNTSDSPSVTQMASYEDLNEVLSGDYVITEEILGMYFTEVLYEAGVGLIEVADRDIVQEGDIVLTDYTGYKDEVAFEGGTAQNQWIDVSNNCGIDTSSGTSTGGFINGFTDGLIGAKLEQPVRSDVIFPEEYHSEDLAGQPAEFEFTVHKIYTPVTMENITDAFVEENLSKNYEVSTVADFMKFLEEELAYNFTMNYLIQNSTFEIPETYVDSRLEDYQAYFEKLYCGETSLEDYLAYYGYTLEAIQAEWRISLEAQIKAELVFAKVVEDQSLELDEAGHEEYVQKIIAVNSSYFPDAESIHKYAGAGDAEAGEEYLKTQTAVRDYMLEKYRNTVTE